MANDKESKPSDPKDPLTPNAESSSPTGQKAPKEVPFCRGLDIGELTKAALQKAQSTNRAQFLWRYRSIGNFDVSCTY